MRVRLICLQAIYQKRHIRHTMAPLSCAFRHFEHSSGGMVPAGSQIQYNCPDYGPSDANLGSLSGADG
jgi:hypothetical protein